MRLSELRYFIQFSTNLNLNSQKKRPRCYSMENQISDSVSNMNADLMVAVQLSHQLEQQSNNGNRVAYGGGNSLRAGGLNNERKHELFVKQLELTFEECVRKFNKHKVGAYYMEAEQRFLPCFIEEAFPALKKILLRFNSNGYKFYTINPEDFPINCIRFDYSKYIVDVSLIRIGLGPQLSKYREDEDPIDDGCEFYYTPQQATADGSRFPQVFVSTGSPLL